MTQRATTALSLHYHVKPGQREAVLGEIKGILDRCAQEPEFITASFMKLPNGRMNSCSTSCGKEPAPTSTLSRGRNHIGRPTWRTSSNISRRWTLSGTHRSWNGDKPDRS